MPSAYIRALPERAPLPPPEFPSAGWQWVTEGGIAVGCTHADVPAQPSSACRNSSFASLDCASTSAKTFERDPRTCRQHLPAAAYWIDSGARLCAEFVDETQHFFLRYVPADQCPHKWLEVDSDCHFTDGGSFDFHPLSGTGISDLIPEILNLKKGEQIPDEVYRKYDSRKIALSLVYKIHGERDGGGGARATYDYLNDTKLQLLFWDRDLEKIVGAGFLNQHQVGQSSEVYSPDERAATEDAILARKVGNSLEPAVHDAQNFLRPKYAYFGLQKTDPAKSAMADLSGIYGNVVAVFADNLKDRTTFTFQDSLNAATDKTAFTPRYQGEEKRTGKYSTYVEAQVWGAVGVSDVAYFLVNCDTFKPVPEDRIALLKRTGKPVYSCVATRNERLDLNLWDSPVTKIEPGKQL